MEYRDELRQAILSGSGEDAPRRGWWGAKRAGRQEPEVPAPEDAAPAPAEAPRDRSPRFRKRTKWARRTRTSEAGPDSRRARRRSRSLWAAYSPVNMLLRIAFAPVAGVAVALSLYIAGSPFSPDMALGHLVAMGGCEPAAVVGLAPASAGTPGYHTPLDRDGNGVSCAPEDLALAEVEMPGSAGGIQSSGAKFIRP